MLDYTHYTCPICHKPLNADEDIAVCPQCGAPHHRRCFLKNGQCAYAADHGGPRQWKPQPDKDGDGTVICGNCGTVNNDTETVCHKCGHALEEVFPPSPSEQQPPVDEGVFYSQFSPYIGIAPDSTMDGYPVMDIATFLGANSGYYLSRFHFMRLQKSKMSWNWSAAIFPVLWALYRKMYRLFWILLGISVLLFLPFACIMARIVAYLLSDPTLLRDLSIGLLPETVLAAWLMIAANVATTGGFVLRAMMASMGNHWYHKHTLRLMNKVRGAETNPLHYRYALSKKGGTAPVQVAVAAAGIAAVLLLYLVLLIVFCG